MRVAFCGASGTGKTTLARWLWRDYGLEFNPVGSRVVASEMGFASPYDVDKAGRRMEFQNNLQRQKIAWEEGKDRFRFVTDRTTLDELAYCALHCADQVDMEYLIRARMHVRRYTYVVVCPVDAFISYEADEHRLQNEVYQRLFDMTLDGLVRRYVDDRRVIRLNFPDLEDRKALLRERLRLL